MKKLIELLSQILRELQLNNIYLEDVKTLLVGKTYMETYGVDREEVEQFKLFTELAFDDFLRDFTEE